MPVQNFGSLGALTAAVNNSVNGNGSHHRPAPHIAEAMQRLDDRGQDPALDNPHNAPNFGRYAVPHVLSFASLFSTAAKTYRDSDEATLHSLENARHMRNDCGIMECLEQRQRLTALLDWHLEPEDETNPGQVELCEKLDAIIRKIKRFTEYRRNLLEALWFGKYAVENAYNWSRVNGQRYRMPWPHPRNSDDDWGWKPVNGDKLEFRFDDGQSFHNPSAYPGQMGIRVGQNFAPGDTIRGHWKVEATSRGLAYFLAPWERKTLVVHKHMIEDMPWEDALHSGRVHGVGIRSRIYWDWFQKQESLALLMEYLERSAGGIELWYFPAGNPDAEADTRKAAQERIGAQRNIVLVPRPVGDDGMAYGVEVIEPGMAGIEQLKDLLVTYFGHRIKRYILGQVLSSEAEATGLGSGVADLHLDTLLSIVKFDATNLEETLTDQLVQPIKEYNFPDAKDIHVRFVIETESPDVVAKMEAFEKAFNMGLKLKASQVAETVGAAMPDDSDEILQSPEAAQSAMMQQGQQPGGQPANGQPPRNRVAMHFDEESLTAELMQELWGDPASAEGQTMTYVAEGGKWVQRQLPGFDTGDRVKAEEEPVERFAKWKEEDHPRDEDGKFGSEGGGKFSSPGDKFTSPPLGTRREFEVELKSIDGDTAYINHPDQDKWHTEIPVESLEQYMGDLTGKVSLPKGIAMEDVDEEPLRNLFSGKAKMIGKGNDGVVFDTGDKVVKASTVVPFHPIGQGGRTIEDAMDHLRSGFETAKKMYQSGVTGIPKMQLRAYGDKAFIIRDKLDIPEKLSRDQLEQVRKSIESAHKAGFAFSDEIQVGIGKDGKVYHFDTGSAIEDASDAQKRDDWDYLSRLYESNGEVFDNDPRWTREKDKPKNPN